MKKITLTIVILLFCFSAKAQVTVTYTYDDLHRLTQASYNNGVGIQYAYDQLGNRTQETRTSTLSIEENELLKNLVVFPNPFQDFLTIVAKEDNLQSLQLIDLQGRIIKQEKVSGSNHQFNLESLPQGVYILQISSDKGKQSVKVVKK